MLKKEAALGYRLRPPLQSDRLYHGESHTIVSINSALRHILFRPLAVKVSCATKVRLRARIMKNVSGSWLVQSGPSSVRPMVELAVADRVRDAVDDEMYQEHRLSS